MVENNGVMDNGYFRHGWKKKEWPFKVFSFSKTNVHTMRGHKVVMATYHRDGLSIKVAECFRKNLELC